MKRRRDRSHGTPVLASDSNFVLLEFEVTLIIAAGLEIT